MKIDIATKSDEEVTSELEKLPDKIIWINIYLALRAISQQLHTTNLITAQSLGANIVTRAETKEEGEK